MTGLYFYKLVSPFSEDITKDCKLTVNEIDHNFLTLKNAEIESSEFNADEKQIVITRKNGEKIIMDISPLTDGLTDGMTTNLEVKYDSVDGVIEISFNEEKVVIDKLITKDNLSKEILTKIYTDSTLKGNGTVGNPVMLSESEKTGTFKPAIKVINKINGETLPTDAAKGDRYVTVESYSDYGYLYNFEGVQKINEDLKETGWRIPSKEDWDNMLNAVELCEYRNHDSKINNNILGKVAGKLLKSKDKWLAEGAVEEKRHIKPLPKPIDPTGTDAYGLSITPAGVGFGLHPVHFNDFGSKGAYWSSTIMYETDVYIKVFDDRVSGVIQMGETPKSHLSIRLVKDYDGKNHNGMENIQGINYKTVLIPSLNVESQHTIWTAANFASDNYKRFAVEPNNGEGVTYSKKHIINEWDGFKWERKELSEGDSIVLLSALNGRTNEEYRIVEGELMSVTDIVIKIISKLFDEEFNQIKADINAINEEQRNQNEEIEGIKGKITNIKDTLEAEIERAKEAEKGLEEKLNSEIEKSEFEDKRIEAKLDAEIERAKGEDVRLETKIDSEINRAKTEEGRLETKIDDEIIRAKDEEARIDSKLEVEIERAKLKEEELASGLTAETEDRKIADNEIIAKAINLNGTVHTYECAKGVFTLQTNDGTPITIKLDSNYGTF